MFKVWLAVLFFYGASALSIHSEAESLSMIQDNSEGVVKRVRDLLQDMADQLEKDAEDDLNVDEEMKCWCKSTVAERTKLIDENSQKSASLRNDIAQLRAKSAQLNEEIDKIKVEVDANEKTLDTAISMRKKELKQFTSAEANSFETIKALDGAQQALAEKMPKAMMQNEVVLEAESPVLKALQHEIKGHRDVLWAIHNKKERKLILEIMSHERDVGFIQSASTNTESSRTFSAPFELIHGTIASLKEAFQKNLQKMQDYESNDQAAHDAAKKAKKDEIAAGLAMLDAKTVALADTDESAANARQELDDVDAALNADKPYLVDVQEQCVLHEKEFAERQKTRQEELAAVSGALSVLSSDESKDKFTQALGHTKRSEKLGSRTLKDYKEERETESKRSQINTARKQMWGTTDLLTVSLLQVPSGPRKEPEAQKLSNLAERTQAYWAATYYSKARSLKAEAVTSKAHSSTAHNNKLKGKAVSKTPSRNKLGLTAEQMAVRKNHMSAAAQGVTKMIDNLVLQEGEEKARKTWCVEEIKAVEKEIDVQKRKKKDQEEGIELRSERIAILQGEVKALEKEQEDADIELAKAGIDRKATCAAFQKTVADQKEAKRLLGMAMKVLESFYGKKKKRASLIRQKAKVFDGVGDAIQRMTRAMGGGEQSLSFNQTRNQELDTVTLLQEDQESQHQSKEPETRAPPPPGFKPYANSAMKGGVVAMITQIVEDTDAMVAEAVDHETHSMEGYEGYVANANAQTRERNVQIVNRKAEIGKLEQFNQEAKLALSDTIHLIRLLRQKDIDLYGVEGCQYLLKNYETRFMERREEINSLKEAQAILGVSGGDASMTVATHTEDSTIGESVELTTKEPVTTDQPETPGSSAHEVVPEGVKIEGPNGETAISKMLGR